MATIKTWCVTTSTYDPVTGNEGSNEDITVEAHSLTMEPSGALSFWVVSHDGMMSILVLAFPAGGWNLVKIAPNKPQESDLVPNK